MLPAPEADARAASDALAERIRAELRASGNWISFARYMELALYAPGLGYYAGGPAKLGAGGDFVTAPDMGTLFARALARQAQEILRPGEAILEFGAGSGALARTLLQEIPSSKYFILETSPDLRQRQKATLGNEVTWLERLPERFRGVMLANEVVDAMPVHAVAWTATGIREKGVTEVNGSFTWSSRPASGELLDCSTSLDLHPAYESEIGLAGQAWMRSAAAALERGALLVVDYGFPRGEYYHAQRASGTLMCHYRHRAHADPFWLPGLQDITAHVDFSALAHAAREGGLEVLGYTSQAAFLINCGLLDLLADTSPEDTFAYASMAAEANKLLSPAEMGELFKVLAVGRGIDAPLGGFARGDRAHTL